MTTPCFHCTNLSGSKKEEGKSPEKISQLRAPWLWQGRNHKRWSLWMGRLLSLLSLVELLRQGGSTRAEGHLAGAEFSHPDLPKDAYKPYTMSRTTNRHSLNHLGDVTNKKWKSEWKENFISNPSCGTWIFQHIWFVKFANVWWLSRKSELIKDISTLSSCPRLCRHASGNWEETAILICCSRQRKNKEKGTESHLPRCTSGLCCP